MGCWEAPHSSALQNSPLPAARTQHRCGSLHGLESRTCFLGVTSFCTVSFPGPQILDPSLFNNYCFVFEIATLLQFLLLHVLYKSSKEWSKRIFIAFNNWNCYNVTNKTQPDLQPKYY